MSLFARRRDPAPAEERSLGFPSWPLTLVPRTASGQVVTAETALRNAAVSACQRVLVTTAAYMPVHATRKQGRSRVFLDPQPSIVRRPSARVTRRNWVAQVVRSMVSEGNAYGQVVAVDQRSYPTQVEVLGARSVSWRPVNGVETLHVDNKPAEKWPLGDIIHIPSSAFMVPGANYAANPVDLARESIGTGLAAERFGASFFGTDAHPSAIIKADANLTKPQAEEIKAAFIAAQQGREPAVFGSGLTYEAIQLNPKDSQFIDLMRFEVEQACRFFGVPPSMVYSSISGQAVTYSNVSQADLQFLKYSLGIWLADVEDAWQAMVGDPIDVKFNVDALLRMDAPSRWEIHTAALAAKARTVNEVREYEDETPFDDPGFDEPGVPEDQSSKATRQLSAVEAVQKIYLGVDAVITSDEAREMVNALGGNLTVPGPDFGQLALPV